jgi:serine phosphatase RsbU (regulator of sigma subunit)
MSELDPTLQRQLKRLGLEAGDRAPDLDTWRQFLKRVSDHYQHTQEDRALLTRSLDLTTTEMNELRGRVESERDRLQSILGAITEAISLMGTASPTAEGHSALDATNIITQVKSAFTERLESIFGEGTGTSMQESSQVRVIQTEFVRLADQVETMLNEMGQHASLRKELEVARAVQQLLLPPEEVIALPGLTLAAYSRSAQECGGDWWNAMDLGDGRVLTVVGDVTGHGIASAMLTATAKAAVDLSQLLGRGKLTCELILSLMNHAIHQAGKTRTLMTAAVAILDPRAGSLTLASAGHAFPYLLRGGLIEPLVAHGEPLGSAPSSEYAAITVRLAAGDKLLWYTDGVTELENDAGEQFTEKRLRSVCQRAAHLDACGLRDELVGSLVTFAGGRPPDDDLTLLVAHLG